MVRQLRTVLIAAVSFGLIALAVMVLGTSSASTVIAAKKTPTPGPSPTPTPTSTADFIFSLNLKAEFGWVGYLVRGGDAGPVYEMCSYGCFWVTNTLHVISRNGFEGDVNLEVLNLPPGVTSEMPNSIFVPKGDGTTISVLLRATADAPLGDATMTLRGTSGTIVHTADVRFMVVDQLPPLSG